MRSSKGFARPYVLDRLLPQVAAHLPDGKTAAGCTVTLSGDVLPLVHEHIVSGSFQSVRPFYVLYAEGEPAEYMTPARFRRLVRLHRAWIVATPPASSSDDRQRGAFVLRSAPRGVAA